jgi:DNA-binding NarL/FixJ family response regulator
MEQADPADPIRVLLVDDHPVVRRGLHALLDSLEDVVVVGEAADGESASRAAQLGAPDVVLMDIQLPGIDGLEATRRVLAARPQTAVLVLTMFDDDATVFAAMQAGARGYLLKGAEQDEIARALRAVVAGEAIFGPGVASRVLAFFAGATLAAPTAFPELTERERQILELLAAGRRTAAIGQALHLAPKTVSNHLTVIFGKLQVASRAEAIAVARDRGLGGAP